MKTSESSVHSLGGIVAFILGNLDEALTVDNLSQRCLLSKYHFYRQFRAYIGVNVERFVQLVRLKRASLQLVFNRQRRVTDVAVDAGFDFPESFTRAFRREYGQSPTQFMRKPDWQTWWKTHHENKIHVKKEFNAMQVDIIDFPETLVAILEHHGPESESYNSSMKFIEWRKENGMPPTKGNTYGIHYTDPKNTFPEDFRLDICVSIDKEVGENPRGVVNKIIPSCRCAVARDTGSRGHVSAADFLIYE